MTSTTAPVVRSEAGHLIVEHLSAMLADAPLFLILLRLGLCVLGLEVMVTLGGSGDASLHRGDDKTIRLLVVAPLGLESEKMKKCTHDFTIGHTTAQPVEGITTLLLDLKIRGSTTCAQHGTCTCTV